MIVHAYDFETTGVNARECEPVSVAVIKAEIHEDGSFTEQKVLNRILQIEADEVPAGAQKVHGISKEMTMHLGVPPAEIISGLTGLVLGYNNNSYDNVIAGRYGAIIQGSIDIFVATRRMKTEGALAKATLSASYEQLTGKRAEGAHDALADVRMTLELIQPIMQHYAFAKFEDLVEFVSVGKGDANMVMPFGKHKGKKLKDLPGSYVRWAMENMTLTGDLKAGFDSL